MISLSWAQGVSYIDATWKISKTFYAKPWLLGEYYAMLMFQMELERMNGAAEEINKLEKELDVSRLIPQPVVL